jgi:ABC-2 type transport system ATP-binding protein
VNDPELVILDEPTDGVDPVGRREIRDVLVKMRGEGKSVLVNSHILSELELVCDRVGMLVQGVVSKQGTIDELTKESQRYEIMIKGGEPKWKDRGEVRFEAASDERTRLVLPSSDPAVVQPVLDRLRSDGHTIESVIPKRESLEDLFVRAVTDPETGELLDPGAIRKKPPAAPPTKPPGGGA